VNLIAAIATGSLAVAGLITGCSGDSVDSACDVQGVTSDVEHMVEESSMSLDSVDTLACSGDWAVAQLTVSGDGTEPEQVTFIFQNAGNGWILKAPEIVCLENGEVESIPEDLADLACATG
jgi:hypothetical protein